MSTLDIASEHFESNRSALGHYTHFQTHRERLTARISTCAPTAGGSLCILGAGNCFDVDLTALASHFEQIHLVDIDQAALTRALAQLPEATRTKFTTHAPIDVSGMYDRLERWARMEITPAELMAHGSDTAESLKGCVGRSFDVVVSACMLSQMQLGVVSALGDRHPLFQAVRFTLNLTHLRTLAELTNPGGKALLVTDLTEASLFPLVNNPLAGLELLRAACASGKVFDFAAPEQLLTSLLDDPVLRRVFPEPTIVDAWLWTNGPQVTFLVYACELARV